MYMYLLTDILLLHSLETHIKPFDRMSEGTYRYEVHPAFTIFTECVESYAS